MTCYNCYDFKIDALIYQSKVALEGLSNEIVKSKMYGYSCDSNAENKVNQISNYLKVLEDTQRKAALGGKKCLNDYEKQAIFEKLRSMTVSCDIDGRRDVIKVIDENLKNKWIIESPNCVSREKWEKISYLICDAFNLDIKVVNLTQDCDLDIDVVSVNQLCDLTFQITRNLIPCDVMVAVSVYQEMCDLDLTINRTEDESELDYKILIQDSQVLFDLATYKKLIDSNLSFDIIKTVYENNCSIDIIEDNLILTTPMGVYPLNALKFKDKPKADEIIAMGIKDNNSEFIDNPDKFLKKLKQDYGE